MALPTQPLQNTVADTKNSQNYKAHCAQKELYVSTIVWDVQANQLHVGFFDKESALIYSFLGTPPHTFLGASKASSPDTLPMLDVTQAHTDIQSAYAVGKEHVLQSHPRLVILKELVLLQQYKQQLVWQYIGLSAQLDSFSVRMSAQDNTIVEHSVQKLMAVSQGGANTQK